MFHVEQVRLHNRTYEYVHSGSGGLVTAVLSRSGANCFRYRKLMLDERKKIAGVRCEQLKGRWFRLLPHNLTYHAPPGTILRIILALEGEHTSEAIKDPWLLPAIGPIACHLRLRRL